MDTLIDRSKEARGTAPATPALAPEMARFVCLDGFALTVNSTRFSSEVVTAVRKIEALVAQRKIGDLLIAHRNRESHPVVK